jgi:hypothetical protein
MSVSGRRRLHEIKHDGFRTQPVISRGKARAFSRNSHDWTDKYPRVVTDAAKIRCRSAVLDGEVIVQDEHGRSDLEALYAAMTDQRPRHEGAFDATRIATPQLPAASEAGNRRLTGYQPGRPFASRALRHMLSTLAAARSRTIAAVSWAGASGRLPP